MLRWTQDDRWLVWTFGDTPDLYNLYVAGDRVVHNLPFEEWYPIYRSYADQKQQQNQKSENKEAA